MDAIRKQASRLREQVAKQQQVILLLCGVSQFCYAFYATVYHLGLILFLLHEVSYVILLI
jgi:hypothetical protein